jgi:bifunctional UDP-N-acetylglucosamine pyrophosphorylase/glucosamine-1-phosphate N-acetyltransferase
MAIDGKHLFSLLDAVDNKNAKGEYYLTDIVAIAKARGLKAAVVEGQEEEVLGVNSRIELAAAEAILQDRLRNYWMAEGVTMQDPSSVYLSHDTELAKDVIIEPNVWFGPGVKVGEGTVIHAFSHIEGANIEADAEVGPYARLRPGADLEAKAKVGNFVEIKNAILGEGAKVNHLSYVGDAYVGPKANIGAGTITCNYDGYNKHLTYIGEGSFIGSNTTLVPPVVIGDGGFTAAGSVITQSVGEDALGITRAQQKNIAGAAKKIRERNAAAKAAGKFSKPDPQAVRSKRSNSPKGDE